MDNSFFEYRDKSAVGSGSDSEIIDNSLVGENLIGSTKKTQAYTIKNGYLTMNNRTLFVAESEESNTEVETDEDDNIVCKDKKSILRRSSFAAPHIILSSDDDTSKRGSLRRQSDTSPNKVILSTSEEEDSASDIGSPELVPRKRIPQPESNESPLNSFVGKIKSKKRLLRIDSDTEDSIIIEHNKNSKVTCIKDTPLKIDRGQNFIKYSDEDMSDDSDGEVARSLTDEVNNDKDDNSDSTNEIDDADTDGPDEDQMVLSRATRMSIMGVIPKDNDSDESDFIHSEDSKPSSRSGSVCSLNDLPDISSSIYKSPPKEAELTKDSSRITCSPFTSPFKDITNKDTTHDNFEQSPKTKPSVVPVVDLVAKENNLYSNQHKIPQKLPIVDDDVTIVDCNPEIIALSSDDEEEVNEEKKSPRIKSSKSSHKVKEENDLEQTKDTTIKRFLVPPSAPSQVVYVKKEVRETELRKLTRLQEDLKNIKMLLDNMEIDTLPDGGVQLIERLTALEANVRLQGDKVANMVVEQAPMPHSGTDQPMSWDELQTASNAVQPRMFGKQAMATHIAERNLILDRLRALHASLASRPAETALAEQPAALASRLLPHQRHALAWLVWRETQRPGGGILADDMGLGKTITMISLILSDKGSHIDNDDDDEDDDEPRSSSKIVSGGTLVVCPASLVQQWAGEVKTHCSRPPSVCLHHGAARAQQAHRLASYDIVITTYNILQRDHEKRGVLMRVRWRRVILDEAHIVRNHKSATSAAASGLRSRRRWALTGTPVHNKDLDLFALVKFLKITPFDDLQMWKKWIDNKSSGGQERLSTIMRCILLRRTKVQLQQKGQLAGLPSRTSHMEMVTLTQQEMNVYQKVLVFSKTLFAQFLHQRAEKQGAEGAGNDAYYSMHKKMIALQGAKPVKSHEILVLLLRLRQVCCHCGLIAAMLDEDSAAAAEDDGGKDLLAELNKLSLDDKRKSGQKQDEEEDVEEEGTSVNEALRSVLSPNNPVFDLTTPSSKIAAVVAKMRSLLDVPGEKIVVVSQWTSVLSLVEQQLRALRVRCVTLSGRVPVSARGALVRALNEGDARVMLLSLCAGGVGLNLCGANHLLLLDPHWNPQLEQQAQDRIYRVGQRKPVTVHRFMCVDTVEQSIRKLQEAKLELADSVLTGARQTNASKLTIEDLKMLFNMGS